VSYLVPLVLAGVLAASGIALLVLAARRNGKRIKGHGVEGPFARTPRKQWPLTDFSRTDLDPLDADPHWLSVRDALPGSARELRPEDDSYVVENPRTPQQGEESP